MKTNNYLNRIEANQLSIFTQKFHKSVLKSIKKFKGNVVKQDNCSYLVSFTSTSDAIYCALKIQSNINYITPKFDHSNRILNIGISSGDPVTDKGAIFEDAISLATRLSEVVDGKIVISSQIKNLFVIENRNLELDNSLIRSLKPIEEKFLTKLMNYMDGIWFDANFKIENLSSELGCSRSQLYRKLKSLTSKTPNNFIKDMRLNNSLNLFHNKSGNISEIASNVGFNSPSYFTKCFYEKFGILPSKYKQQHIY